MLGRHGSGLDNGLRHINVVGRAAFNSQDWLHTLTHREQILFSLLRSDMRSDRHRDVWWRLLVFGCFVGIFLLLPHKVDQFYLDQSGPDLGAQFLFRGWLHLLEWLGFRHRVFATDLFAFQAAVIFLFAGVMLLTKVPLPVATGGALTLLAVWGIFHDLSSFYHAIESWTILVASMFIVLVVFWKGSLRNYVAAAAFGLVLGYLPLMRQSAILHALLPSIFLLIACAARAAATWYLGRRAISDQEREMTVAGGHGSADPAQSSPFRSLQMFVVPVMVMLVFFLATRTGVMWLQTRIDKTPGRPHGAGYPLFLSLGFVNNPYNIAWDDDCAVAQGLLIEGAPWYEDANGQKKLAALWLSRVKKDPALLLRGILAKSLYLVRYFSNTLDPLMTGIDGYPMKPSGVSLSLGIAFVLAMAFCIRAFVRVHSDRMFVLASGTLGILTAGIGPLVLLVPFYLGSAIASFLTVIFVLAPSAWFALNPGDRPDDRAEKANKFVYKTGGIILSFVVCVVLVFALARSVINGRQARRIIENDPIESIRRLGHTYAYHFNRLPVVDQQKVIDRLLTQAYRASVFRPVATTVTEGPFSPTLAFVAENLAPKPSPASTRRTLFLVAKMSASWKPLAPSRIQGPRNSVLFAMKNVSGAPPILHYLENPGNYSKIPDANWDDRYRMFCLPQNSDVEERADFLYAGVYNFKDGEHGPAGLVLQLVSGNKLYRGGETSP